MFLLLFLVLGCMVFVSPCSTLTELTVVSIRPIGRLVSEAPETVRGRGGRLTPERHEGWSTLWGLGGTKL